MGKFIDRTGQVFGKLTVLHKVENKSSEKRSRWACRCECGNIKVVLSDNMVSGTTRSCGCAHGTHGFSTSTDKEESGTYHVWEALKQRITKPSCRAYKNYGGRGISIDPRWKKFENFLLDMGVRPEGHTLERLDNDGDYTLSNCKWATRIEQNSNTRRTKLFDFNGKPTTLSEVSRATGINLSRLRHRVVVQCMSVEEAVSRPVSARTF